MERDSFLFYRSFYESIKGLPKDIQLEVYTAIMEYAIYGNLPEGMKPFANSVFTLVKPILNANLQRYENGKKGGRKRCESSTKPLCSASKKKQTSAESAYTLTYEQEVGQMRSDEKWRKTICEDFNITAEEYEKRLSRFLDRCNEDKARKGKEHHDSFVDCQSHLRYWMSKAYAHQQSSTPAPEDDAVPFPEMGDSFGGVDYDEQ